MEDIISMLRRHEGVRHTVYKDSLGIPTIGVGFNLQRPDASLVLASVGSSLQACLGGTPLTDQQVNEILQDDVNQVTKDLNVLFPDFGTYPEAVQLVLQDVRFNMGPSRLRGFVHAIAAVKARNWQESANQFMNSNWSKQVGIRAKEDCDLLRSA